MLLIETVYPHFKIKNEWVLHWITLGKAMDYDQVMAKLIEHIRRSPYPPSLEEIAVFSEDGPQCFEQIKTIRTHKEVLHLTENYSWMAEYTI